MIEVKVKERKQEEKEDIFKVGNLVESTTSKKVVVLVTRNFSHPTDGIDTKDLGYFNGISVSATDDTELNDCSNCWYKPEFKQFKDKLTLEYKEGVEKVTLDTTTGEII